MALSPDDLERTDFLRMLIMGPAKVGKSTLIVATSPGPVRVLLCEDDSALQGALDYTRKFDFERITTHDSLISSIVRARKDAKEGLIQTVLVDPMNIYVDRLEEAFLGETDKGRGGDGRRAYTNLRKAVKHAVDALFTIPAHVIVCTHYLDPGGGQVKPDDGADPTPLTGEGVVPLLPGKLRKLFPSWFHDVVWMDFDVKSQQRVLITGPRGVWGPGSRSLKGTRILPADVEIAAKEGKKMIGIKAFLKIKKQTAEERAARRKEE